MTILSSYGTKYDENRYPALKRWAIFRRLDYAARKEFESQSSESKSVFLRNSGHLTRQIFASILLFGHPRSSRTALRGC